MPDFPNEWHSAIPVSYLNDRSENIGRVYVGVSQGPPLQVREQDFGYDPGEAQIVMEFENIMGVAHDQLIQELHLPELRAEHTLRLALHLPSARKFCVHLITALAGSGDRVASLLHEKMIEAMNEIRRQEEEP